MTTNTARDAVSVVLAELLIGRSRERNIDQTDVVVEFRGAAGNRRVLVAEVIAGAEVVGRFTIRLTAE